MTTHLVLAIAGWLIGWYLLWRVPSIPPAGGGAVSYAVVIPARDEAHNIGPLVEHVLAQTVAPVEVVVVDDDSSDGTGDVAAAAGASVVRSAPLPAGWTGKSWACQQGADATTAPLLVFLDADVRLSPEALGKVARLASERDGLLSVVPFHTVRRPYEWLSMLFGIVSIMGVGLASMRRSRISGAFGPCLALSRRDYAAIGGHASIAGDVVDDLALAARTEQVGLPVDVFGGGRDLTYRMYPSGPRSLLEGWTKNIATGAGRTPPLRSLAAVAWISGAIASVLVALQRPALGAVLVLLWALQMAHHARQVGSFPAAAIIAYPVQLAFFCTVFVRSLVLVVLRRPVAWRGRDVGTRSSAAGSVA